MSEETKNPEAPQVEVEDQAETKSNVVQFPAVERNTLPSQRASAAQPTPVLIDNVDTFGMLLNEWHSAQLAMTRHFLSIPEGTEMEIAETGKDAEKIVVGGDLRKGFLLGIHLALNHFGRLPFGPTQPSALTDDSSNQSANDEVPPTKH